MSDRKLKIGITHGDINGVNYELLLKLFSDNRMSELFTPIIYGSNKVAGAFKREGVTSESTSFNVVRSADDALPKGVNIINCISESVKIDIGKSTPQAGQYAIAALSAAIADMKEGKIDALVTCPINKSNVQNEEFKFVGHTELLTSEFEGEPLMFMVSENIKVGLVTIHEPLANVPSLITKEAVLSKLKLMKESLVRDFAITNPRIAVLGLNPHAGDEGLLGSEEQTTIIPAIATAKQEGIYAFGPFSADGFFAKGGYEKFDAVLAMYHDQGLIPFKAIARDGGVNFTSGLNVVRTSPAHGVGYDIAGKGEADEASLRSAIYAAVDIYRNRANHLAASANPLTSYSKDSWGADVSASDIAVKEDESAL